MCESSSNSLSISFLIETPWDERALGIKTFEVANASYEKLSWIVENGQPGHYTVKINPLISKRFLHQHGFYYCDTIIEPFCTPNLLKTYQKDGISLTQIASLDELQDICNRAFTYDRFHRDFNIDNHLADLRYNFWLEDLYKAGSVFDLRYHGELAGFWAFSNEKILLHALAEKYRGKGLAKYFWSLACQQLFQREVNEITSSISASNIAVLNLYVSLGFKFRNQQDIYHLLINQKLLGEES